MKFQKFFARPDTWASDGVLAPLLEIGPGGFCYPVKTFYAKTAATIKSYVDEAVKTSLWR